MVVLASGLSITILLPSGIGVAAAPVGEPGDGAAVPLTDPLGAAADADADADPFWITNCV